MGSTRTLVSLVLTSNRRETISAAGGLIAVHAVRSVRRFGYCFRSRKRECQLVGAPKTRKGDIHENPIVFGGRARPFHFGGLALGSARAKSRPRSRRPPRTGQ